MSRISARNHNRARIAYFATCATLRRAPWRAATSAGASQGATQARRPTTTLPVCRLLNHPDDITMMTAIQTTGGIQDEGRIGAA